MEKKQSKPINQPRIKDSFGNFVPNLGEEEVIITFSALDVRDYEGEENEPEMQIIVLKKLQKENKFEKTHETEIHSQGRNCTLSTQFKPKFIFSEMQIYKIQLFDKRLGGNFLIGEHIFTLGEFLGRNHGRMTLDMKRSHTKMGEVTLQLEQGRREVCYFNFVLEGIKLNNFGIINTISPLIKLWRPKISQENVEKIIKREMKVTDIEFDQWDCVFKSTGDGKNPVFRRGIIGALLLCHGIWDCPLRVNFNI